MSDVLILVGLHTWGSWMWKIEGTHKNEEKTATIKQSGTVNEVYGFVWIIDSNLSIWYSLYFDGIELSSFKISEKEIDAILTGWWHVRKMAYYWQYDSLWKCICCSDFSDYFNVFFFFF